MKITPLILILSLALLASCTRSNHADAAWLQELAGQGVAALNAQDYTTAQTLAGEATRLKPQFAEAWVLMGMASVKLGQVDRAREAYEQALSLHQERLRQNPSDAHQVIQQIFLLGLLGQADAAESRWQRAQMDFPGEPQLEKLAGDFAAFKESWEEWRVESE